MFTCESIATDVIDDPEKIKQFPSARACLLNRSSIDLRGLMGESVNLAVTKLTTVQKREKQMRYAHLIANGHCDRSDVEVSVGIYSASACGLYGYGKVAMAEAGSVKHPSTLTLVSTHGSPEIGKNSTALLEVLPASEPAVQKVVAP